MVGSNDALLDIEFFKFTGGCVSKEIRHQVRMRVKPKDQILNESQFMGFGFYS